MFESSCQSMPVSSQQDNIKGECWSNWSPSRILKPKGKGAPLKMRIVLMEPPAGQLDVPVHVAGKGTGR